MCSGKIFVGYDMKFHDVCVVSVSVATTKSQFTLYLLLMIAS